MASYTDALAGLVFGEEYKAPCAVATTAAVDSSMTGLPVIDGYQTLANDRILVWKNANQTLNGIWLANTGAWTRANDFTSSSAVAAGTQVYVFNGTLYGKTAFACQNNNIVFGTTPIIFAISASGLLAGTALGSGVAAALGNNVGTAGAVVVYGGAGGTPSSINLNNATGNPTIGLANASGTPASLGLGTASGTPPAIGLANGTGLPIAGVSGWGASVANALAQALNAAGGLLGISALGTGVLTALGLTPNTAGGFTTSPVPNGNLAHSSITVDGQTVALGGAVAAAYWASGTTNATPAPSATSPAQMMGFGFAFTPARTGTVRLSIEATLYGIGGGTAAGNGLYYQISYGTGTAPSANAALTGTQVGKVQAYKAPSTYITADLNVPIHIEYVVTGLTPGTAYWLDLASAAYGGGNLVGFTSVQYTIQEQ